MEEEVLNWGLEASLWVGFLTLSPVGWTDPTLQLFSQKDGGNN